MTTVKTYLRIKPHKSEDIFSYTIKPKSNKKCFIIHGKKGLSKHIFEEIFDHNADQKDIYEHFNQSMLESAFSGVNLLDELSFDELWSDKLGKKFHH